MKEQPANISSGDSQEQTPRSHRPTGTENFPLKVWLEHSLRQIIGTWPKPTGHEADLRVKTASVENVKFVSCGGKAQPESLQAGSVATVLDSISALVALIASGRRNKSTVIRGSWSAHGTPAKITSTMTAISVRLISQYPINYFCFNIWKTLSPWYDFLD